MGWKAWFFRINPVSISLYLVLTIIVVLAVWRITGYHPLQQALGPGSSSDSQLSRAYVLLGTGGGRIYFFDRQAENIWRYDPAHSDNQELVGSLPSIEAILPTVQSDKLALLSASTEAQTGIYVLDLASGDLQQIDLPTDYILAPTSVMSWSPNDKHIAFVAYKEDRSDLFVARADGTDVQRLTYHGASIGTVTWVDQTSLAFVSDWEGQDLMYLIDSDGGDLRRAR